MRNNIIQVLWVEDDPKITIDYPRQADMLEGIELYPFSCWEDAELELDRDYSRWDAIILDAKCRFLRTDGDKAPRFLMNVFRRLDLLAKSKNRTLPWYVLSGVGEDEIHDLIPVDIPWDADWEKISNRRFYSKNGNVIIGGKEIPERLALFHRLKLQVINYNHQLSVEYNEYPDVFHALDRLGLESKVGFYLMPLLEPIHFKGTKNEDYNRRYIDLRKALEEIFRDIVKNGILPSNIVSKKEKDSVNLSWSSLFLGGTQPENLNDVKGSEKIFWSEIERLQAEPLLPKQLSAWLKEAIFQTGGAAHTAEAEAEIAMNLDKYLPQVGGSPYMLRSLAMGLCDFILWYDGFLKEHPDEEINAITFWRKRDSKF